MKDPFDFYTMDLFEQNKDCKKDCKKACTNNETCIELVTGKTQKPRSEKPVTNREIFK